MKNFFFFAVIFLVVVSGCTVLAGRIASAAADEVYEGSAIGHKGSIHVQVRMNGGFITEIIIVDSQEDRFVGGAAMEELIELVIEYNTVDLDAVTGATVTSKGFLDAVNNAIMSANE